MQASPPPVSLERVSGVQNPQAMSQNPAEAPQVAQNVASQVKVPPAIAVEQLSSPPTFAQLLMFTQQVSNTKGAAEGRCTFLVNGAASAIKSRERVSSLTITPAGRIALLAF